MRICRYSLGLAALLVLPFPSEGQQHVYRILPLGDSITQGVYPAQSYRYRLWQRLLLDGVPFDFVGSRIDNYAGMSPYPPFLGQPFDLHHEGHGGWRAQDLIDGCTSSDPCRTEGQGQLATWLQFYTPDIVLLHIGTNDILQGAPWYATAFSVWYTIQYLRFDNPNVVILLGQIIPINGRTRHAMLINYLYAFIADFTDRPSSPVILVDHFTGFNLYTLTDDGIHPNAAGEEWMAARWHAAVRQVVEGQAVAEMQTPVPHPAGNRGGPLQSARTPLPAHSRNGA